MQMGKREDLIKDFVFITGVGRNRYVGREEREGGMEGRDECGAACCQRGLMNVCVCVYGLFDGSIMLCHHGAHTNSNANERKFILTTPTTLLPP